MPLPHHTSPLILCVYVWHTHTRKKNLWKENNMLYEKAIRVINRVCVCVCGYMYAKGWSSVKKTLSNIICIRRISGILSSLSVRQYLRGSNVEMKTWIMDEERLWNARNIIINLFFSFLFLHLSVGTFGMIRLYNRN